MQEVDIKLKQDRNARERLQAEREFGFKIYDIVQKSIEEENKKKQLVARAFIIAMVVEDNGLRQSLLTVLETEGTDTVKATTSELLRKEQTFQLEQNQIAAATETPKSFNWEDWDYDIFWCESDDKNATANKKEQAEIVVRKLKAEGAKGRIRPKLLPESINARPGYQISGHVIRRFGNEKVQADALKALSDKVLAENNYNGEFEIQSTGSQSKWYISACVCP